MNAYKPETTPMTQAQCHLAEENMDLVGKLVNVYRSMIANSPLSWEDAIAEGNMALCIAAQEYPRRAAELQAKGVAFRTYAYTNIKHRLFESMHAYLPMPIPSTSRRRDPSLRAPSVVSSDLPTAFGSLTLGDLLPSGDCVEDVIIVNDFMSLLSNVEAVVFALYCQGYAHKQIMQATGYTEARITKGLRRARKKLILAVDGEYLRKPNKQATPEGIFQLIEAGHSYRDIMNRTGLTTRMITKLHDTYCLQHFGAIRRRMLSRAPVSGRM